MKELKQTRIIYLVSGYLEQRLTPEETEELEAWKQARPSNAKLFEELTDVSYRNVAIADWNPADTESSLIRLQAKRDNLLVRRKLWWPYAAAMSMLLVFGIYFYQAQNASPSVQIALVNDALPGSSKATLKLSDGSVIQLDATQNGTIAHQSGISIIKAKDGSIIYQVNDLENNSSSQQYNTIDIPRGGKYRLRLPDGTEVWLNAASSLTYPISFREQTERRVELTGEAYFSVTHNIAQPFIVKTYDQSITVLGTEFNVNAYPDENKITTTLLKGSVKVQAGNLEILKPGQQTVLLKGQLKVQEANTEGATGWKNDLFLFYETDMKSIMRQLARWYDVDVDISTIPNNQFYGEIPRDVKLSQVLSMLEATSGLKFQIEGRRITMQ